MRERKMNDPEKIKEIKEHLLNAIHGKPIAGWTNRNRDPIGLKFRNSGVFKIDTDFIYREVLGALELVEKMLDSH
jgi:hypothetical protein